MSLLLYHKGTFWALHTLPTSCELFISTSAALTHKAYGSRGDGNAVGSAGRDTARRQRLQQNCEQEGAAFLIPSIFLTVFSLPCSHPDTSPITPLQTPSLVPQMPLEEGSGAGPCCAWTMVKKAWNQLCHSALPVPFPHATSQELRRHSETNSTVMVSGRAILVVIKSQVFTCVS